MCMYLRMQFVRSVHWCGAGILWTISMCFNNFMLCMHIITRAARHGTYTTAIHTDYTCHWPPCMQSWVPTSLRSGIYHKKKNGYGFSFALRTDIRQISAAGPGGGEEGNSWPLKLNAKIPRSSNERPTNVCHIDTILHLLLITSTYSHLLCTFSSTYVGYTVVMTVPFVQVCGDFELD